MYYILFYFLGAFITFRFWVWRCPPKKVGSRYLMDGIEEDYSGVVRMTKNAWMLEQAATVCIICWPVIFVFGILRYLSKLFPMILNLFTFGIKNRESPTDRTYHP